jgi:hypothetical protein
MLSLISDTDSAVLSTTRFTIPVSELEKLGIALLPENAVTEKEVRDREEIFAPLASPSHSISIDAWPNHEGRTYYDGDMLSINLCAGQDCYFKIFHIDVNNQRQRIYPNQYDRNNFLKANTVITIPGDSGFLLHAPYGQETIYIVASNVPLDLPDSELREVNATREVIANTTIARGLTVVNKQQAPQNVATGTAYFTFTILAPK